MTQSLERTGETGRAILLEGWEGKEASTRGFCVEADGVAYVGRIAVRPDKTYVEIVSPGLAEVGAHRDVSYSWRLGLLASDEKMQTLVDKKFGQLRRLLRCY